MAGFVHILPKIGLKLVKEIGTSSFKDFCNSIQS